MTDDFIDLSALDPARDQARFDSVARAIARDAMAARADAPAERAERADILAVVVAWARPVLVAAGVVVALAIPALAHFRSGAAEHRAASAADVLGIPPELNDLLQSTRTPSLEELRVALGSANGQ